MRNKQTLLFKSQSETKTASPVNSFKSLQKKKVSKVRKYNTTLNCNVACSFSKRRSSSTSEGQGTDQAATSSFFQHIKSRTQLLCSTFVPCSYQPAFTQGFIQCHCMDSFKVYEQSGGTEITAPFFSLSSPHFMDSVKLDPPWAFR